LSSDYVSNENVEETEMQIAKIKHGYANFTLAVEDVMLTPNKIIGLVGANGAGKSTLMTLLAGYIKANRAFELSDDYNIDDILFIPSTLTLYEYLSVEELVKVAVGQATKEVTNEFVLAKLGLERKRATRIEDLSQGMQKKLTLINMFTQTYTLLILDEPFNSIDLQYIYQLKEELKVISQRATVLVSSHILDTLSNLCDEFIYLKDGYVLKQFVNSDQAILERELFE